MWNSDQPTQEQERPKIVTRNNTYTFDVGDSFNEKVLEVARNERYGAFQVYLNGRAIEPEDAPSTLQAGDVVDLRPEDKAGLV